MTAPYTNTDLLQLRTKQWVARIKRKTRNQAYQISVSCRQTVSGLIKQPMGSASAFVSDLPNVTDTDTYAFSRKRQEEKREDQSENNENKKVLTKSP